MSRINVLTEQTLAQHKPHAEIENLIVHFLPNAEIKQFNANRILPTDRSGERLCVILLNGQVDLSRTEDGILKGTLKAPFISGIAQPEYTGNTYSLMSATPVKVAFITYREAMRVISEQALWKDFSQYLIYIMGLQHVLNYQSVGRRSRDIINQCLRDLMTESEDYRLKTNACTYIMEKTALSRSGVMGILSQMKREKRIGIKTGVLIFLHETVK